jgi:hypothetical protein
VSADHDGIRPLLGGYVLGGLDDADQRRVDAHLSTCAECLGEADGLAPVPELLQRLPADRTAPPLEQPTRAGLEAFLRRARPRRPWPKVLTSVCVVAVVLAVVFALAVRAGRPPQAQPAGSAPASVSSSLPGSAPGGTVVEFMPAGGSGLAGRATLTARQWGVSVALELTGLPGNGPFVLHVLGRGGQAEQAACWGRTATASARVTGASSIQLSNVDAVTVSDRDGHLLGSAKAG